MLSDSQIEFYREHGYLVVENVLGGETLAALRRVTAEFVQKSRDIAASNAVFDVGPGHSPQNPVLRRVKDPQRQHPVYDRVMRSSAIIDIVAALIGPDVRFDHSKLNYKPANGDAAVEWHQDWAYYPHTNDDLLAVGVMIEDCTPENGPVMVIPGSHKGPVYNHHFEGRFVGAIDLETEALDVTKAVPLTGPAGSVTIHHVRTIHGSAENTSDRTRPLLVLSYAAVDAWPIVDSYPLEEFNSRIVHGHPTLQPRQVALPIRIPLPRVPEADSIFDDQQAVRGRSFQTNDRV